MKTAKIKIMPGPAPEAYVSIPVFIGEGFEARFRAHCEAQEIEERMERAKDVTPKRESEK